MKRLLLCLLCICAVRNRGTAHVLDQYLQVTQVALAPDGVRIELRMIPGAQVADCVFALIDTDRDGRLATTEQEAYAHRVWQDLALTINQHAAPLALAETTFPERAAMNEGLGTIRLTFTAALALSAASPQQLNFQNHHLPTISVYLANALVPASDAITINRQERDALQRGLQINFQTRQAATRAGLRWLGCGLVGLALVSGIFWWSWRRRALRSALARCLMVFSMMMSLLMLSAAPAFAHEQPTTLMVLDVAPDTVAMTLHIPLSELELAFGHAVAQNPEATLPQWQASFNAYLRSHLQPTTDGKPWSVAVLDLQLQKAEQTQSGPFQEIVVQLALTPPAGVNTRRFTLRYDAILHQVVTHKALVFIRHDWERGQTAEQPAGIIRVNTETTQIEPLEINLEKGNAWAGFKGMVSLGMQHIKEGTDHLLFLLVLLLPATLLVSGKRWGGFGGSRYSLVRLLKIVTAFTLGHSLTLLAGASGWLRLPPQPVEVLIAFSILVSAMHALRPLFPGKETYVAAGFGLVHGLAFATVLADLNLSAGPLALSILGFNLGIELMQLFVIAVTIPWLVLLSLTPFYARVRILCAALAALAALGWMASRVTGQTNFIERAMQAATEFAPLGVLFLALLAVPAYLYHASQRRADGNRPASAHELLK